MRYLIPPSSEEVDLNSAYAHPTGEGRHVRANFVVSIDGAVTLGGRSRGLSSKADRLVFHTMRRLCDVILVGAGTARVEGYAPLEMPEEVQTARQAAGLAPLPRLAVISGSLRFEKDQPLLSGEGLPPLRRPIIFTRQGVDPSAVAELSRCVEIIQLPSSEPGRVPLERVLDVLEERGLRRVLCEGGPGVFGELLAGDLLDELCLTLATQIVGTGEHRLVGGTLEGPRSFDLRSLLEDDGSLFMRLNRA